MKKTLTGLLCSAVMVSVLAVGPAALAQENGQANKQRLHRPGATSRERHPKMHAAIGALEAAKAELQRADNDFGGHKKDAIESVDNALKQLRLALQFDKY